MAELGECLVVMRSPLALLLLLLSACFPAPSSPTTALTPSDRAEVARMRQLWLQHGLPDPGDCGDEIEIVWPASADDVRVWCCRRQPCPGVDACQTSRRVLTGRVWLLVVRGSQPRESWRHELGHVWGACAGLPPGHSERWMRWLRAVEGRAAGTSTMTQAY